MKKFYGLITLLVLVMMLVACGGGAKLKDVSQAKEYFNVTVSEYKAAESAAVVLTMQDEETTITTELAYNKSKSEYSLKMTTADGTIASVIKGGKSYMDTYGSKKVVDIEASELSTILENYTFEKLSAYVLNVFGGNFFDVATIISAEEGKAVLECDVFSLEVNSEMDPEEQEDLMYDIQMLSSLKLEFEFADGKVTKLVALFEDMDANVSKVSLEFKSVAEQTIEVANASEYEAQ